LFAVNPVYKISKQFGLISDRHEADLRSKKKLPLNLLLLDPKGTSGAKSDLVSFNFSFRVGEEVEATTNK
jgi:hypothetical protein